MKQKLFFELKIFFLLIMSVSSIFGIKKIDFKKKRLDFDNKIININNIIENNNKNYLLYIKAIDCPVCIQTAIKYVNTLSSNTIFIIGYVHENELVNFEQLLLGERYLKDNKYLWIRKFRLKLITPILFVFNKSGQIIKTIGYREIMQKEENLHKEGFVQSRKD